METRTNKRTIQQIQISKERLSLLLFSICVFGVLIEPEYIAQATTTPHQIFRILKVVVSLAVIALFLIRRANLSKLLIGCIAFFLLQLFTTFLHEASIVTLLNYSAYAIVLLLFMQILLETDPELLIKALSIVVGCYIHINLVCRFVYPDGMYVHDHGYTNCWFLGYDNVAAIIILVGSVASAYRIITSRDRFPLWDWSVICSGLIFIFVQGMATAILFELLFFVLIFLSRMRWFKKTHGIARMIIIGMFVLFFLIQFFNVQQVDFITDMFSLLGKDTTFTGRTRIWKIAWNGLMQDGLLFGKGVHTGAEYQVYFGWYVAVHLHCYYLQVLFEGGITSFVVFFLILYFSASRFDKMRNHSYTAVFLSGMAALMFLWQVEAYGDILKFFYIILFLFYNAPLFEKQQEEREKSSQHMSNLLSSRLMV